MEEQIQLFKGELMEELLRKYFINLGYYVVRGVKYNYEGIDITDVDLFLYGRISSLTRQRINVDIKNKKSPQTFERILWANGLMKLLNFNSCIVATTDRRSVIHSFGQLHNTTILDGSFLEKIRSNNSSNRLSEEELLAKFSKYKTNKVLKNKNWRHIYESAKARLLTEQDFSGVNSNLLLLEYFFEVAQLDSHKREESLRMIYLLLSHVLITVDYIIKDIAFLESEEKAKRLSDGFKFGNLGKEGVDKIINMAVQISGNRSANSVLKSLESVPVDILKEFFSKNENAKRLFQWAREFEYAGFTTSFKNPNEIESHLQGVISVMLDYFKIERKKFFDNILK